MKLNLEDKLIEISKEELDSKDYLLTKMKSFQSLQVFDDGQKLMVIQKYENGWKKNWLLYIIHYKGKKITRISKNHLRSACEHNESTNYWTTVYKRHWWN